MRNRVRPYEKRVHHQLNAGSVRTGGEAGAALAGRADGEPGPARRRIFHLSGGYSDDGASFDATFQEIVESGRQDLEIDRPGDVVQMAWFEVGSQAAPDTFASRRPHVSGIDAEQAKVHLPLIRPCAVVILPLPRNPQCDSHGIDQAKPFRQHPALRREHAASKDLLATFDTYEQTEQYGTSPSAC